MADKMTNRQALTFIVNGNITAEVKAWAEGEIAKLNAKNDKRKNTKSKDQIANEGIMDSILSYIENHGAQVASSLGAALAISTQKASALCKLLVDGGKLTVADRKVKGKGAVKEYSLAVSPTDTDTADEADEVAES